MEKTESRYSKNSPAEAYMTFNETLDGVVNELNRIKIRVKTKKDYDAFVRRTDIYYERDRFSRLSSAVLSLAPHFRQLAPRQQQSTLGYMALVKEAMGEYMAIIQLNELIRFRNKDRTHRGRK